MNAIEELKLASDKAKLEQDLARRVAGPVFVASKDSIGLPQEDPQYASSKCKTCHGKGYAILHVKPIVSPYGNVYSKFHVVCDCVHKGYAKTRLKVQAWLDQGLKLEEAAKKAKFNL